MIIKKFTAKTEAEAAEAAKQELGDNIVIMNVKSVKNSGLFGFLKGKQTEITVALEENKESLNRAERREALKKITKLNEEESRQTDALTGNTSEMEEHEKVRLNTTDLEKKLDNLQILLENQMKTDSDEENRKRVLAPEDEEKEQYNEQEQFMKLLYNTMIDNEVDEKIANQLLDDMQRNYREDAPLDYILANLYQKMILKFGNSEGVVAAKEGPEMVVFLGPTGVGKTTTIAKLASYYTVEKKKKVVLFTTDTYRIAAAEQLRTYADILAVPLRVIYNTQEFIQEIENFNEYDYIFVDTSGYSPNNEDQMADMKVMLDAVKEKVSCQCFLVLSATTKYKDLIHIATAFRRITDYQLIFTKLDETGQVGNLLNIKLIMDTPIAYVTYGQNVPSDIEPFNPQKTVKQLLGGKTVV